MNQSDILLRNAEVRRQFAHNCATLSAQIVELQTSNEQLSQRLIALMARNKLLVDRARAYLAK